MGDDDWRDPQRRALTLFISGLGLRDTDAQGKPLVDAHLLWLLNAGDGDLECRIPDIANTTGAWTLLLDSGDDAARETIAPAAVTHLLGRSCKLFSMPSKDASAQPSGPS
jgi:glycogen operon protein